MSEEQGNNPRIPLSPDKGVHVIRDGTLTGAALELEARRFIWVEALRKCVWMLNTAIRSRESALQSGLTWRSADQTFPTPLEGFQIGTTLDQMAVITFLTIFNAGFEDEGKVAGNRVAAIASFREECIQKAFPQTVDRQAFDAMLERLKKARDGLLVHADGGAQEMEHHGILSSFKPQHGGVTPGDCSSLLQCASKLLGVMSEARVPQAATLQPPGEDGPRDACPAPCSKAANQSS